METVEEKIDRFRRYNRTMIAAALAKPNRRHQGIPAKLLLCSIFDSLSIAAFPIENGVGKRYRETVSNHSSWVHHDRVSLLQLCGVFDDMTDVPREFSGLDCWAKAERAKRFAVTNRLSSSRKHLTADPTLQETLNEWPLQSNGEPKKLSGKIPYVFTHNNLLWMYRNKLAHEFRLPGKGAEPAFRMEFEPHYQQASTITEIDPVDGFKFRNRWELIYPTGFFVKIAKETLESICEQYRINESSPFLSYQEGRSWL